MTRLSTPRNILAAYLELTKPGIGVFVTFTASTGFYVASMGQPHWLLLIHTIVGILVATSGSLALNQYLERDVDRIMTRTRRRPLPSERLTPRAGLVFGLVLATSGVLYLGILVGWLAAGLTAASTVLYLFAYTPLKSVSYAATFVGALPGAAPALIGWAAASGQVTWGALVLFGIGFCWQLPHVLSLAWMLREDYKLAGFFLCPPGDLEGIVTGRQMVLFSLVLLVVSTFPSALALTGGVYLIGALVLGLWMTSLSVAALRSMSDRSARRVFFGTLMYQPLLLILMIMDTTRG